MTDRQLLTNDLIHDEGLRLTLYPDSRGFPTIGVGRNVRDKGITSAEAMLLLDHDIDECIHDLMSFGWFSSLDPVRQRVLVNMRFNLGPNRFRGFTKMLHAVAIGDYAQAAMEMRNSVWATQVKDRAAKLARRMETGDDL